MVSSRVYSGGAVSQIHYTVNTFMECLRNEKWMALILDGTSFVVIASISGNRSIFVDLNIKQRFVACAMNILTTLCYAMQSLT